MSAALVQRPRRKAHLAGLQGGLWLSVCDRVALTPEGTTVTSLEDAVETIDGRASEVCADCRRLILMADAVHRLGVGRLVASLELVA